MKEQSLRQSFLGEKSEEILTNCKVAFIGLGGGGSHIVQQWAHLGGGNFALYDFDSIDKTNLNRLVGATLKDVKNKTLKTAIAERVIKNINPHAHVQVFNTPWQESATSLRECDIIFGCLDSYQQRRDLELFSRRFLIPYIDIGMDVYEQETGYSISGQVIMSLPGSICMHCMQYLREELLEKEAAKYGGAGGRPQVVWPNGILASTAVGLAVKLLCPWHSNDSGSVYLEYDGIANTVIESPRMEYLRHNKCQHFFDTEGMGDPFYLLRKKDKLQ